MPTSNVSLKEYIERRIDSVKETLIKAEEKFDILLRAMGDENENKFTSIDHQLRTLNTFKDTQNGKADMKDVQSARLVAYIGLALGILTLILRLLGE
jgi:hypothetical protein